MSFDEDMSRHLVAAGLTLDRVEALERVVARRPRSRAARLKLLAFYFLRQTQASLRERRRAHILWFIKNEPGAMFLGFSPFAMILPSRDAEGYELARESWQRKIASPRARPRWIANAAGFIGLEEPERAVALLERVRGLQPRSKDWAHRLASQLALMKRWADSLEVYRELLILEGPRQRVTHLDEIARVALEAGELEAARRYAEDLLKNVRKHWDRGGAFHNAHSILGRVALAGGEVTRAKRELLRATKSPWRQTFGTLPHITLANDLLVRGERATVLAYLRKGRRLWTCDRDRIQGWIEAIEAGESPELHQHNFEFCRRSDGEANP